MRISRRHEQRVLGKMPLRVKGNVVRRAKNAALETDELEAEAELSMAHTIGKRKCTRKPKSAIQEADEPEPEQEMAQTMDALKP